MTETHQTTDELLRRVHQRLGGLGIEIVTYGDGTIEVTWRRDYGEEGLSDQRWLSASSLHEALLGVLAREDEADERDAAAADEELWW